MLLFGSRRNAVLIACSLGLLGLMATAGAATSRKSEPPAQASAAAARSSSQQLAVANHLRSRGAIFYGAWWCPACTQQKALFGKEAGGSLPYLECSDASGSARCSAAEIRAFPTWDMPGKPRLVGVQSVEELARWSGFESPGAR
jgi:hypothetical protein